jgi:hypothetical protein
MIKNNSCIQTKQHIIYTFTIFCYKKQENLNLESQYFYILDIFKNIQTFYENLSLIK